MTKLCQLLKTKKKVKNLNGPRGSGKTFLYNTLMNVMSGEEKIVVLVASTGIAATLLAGSRTCHSQLKLPIPLKSSSVPNMRASTEDAKFFERLISNYLGRSDNCYGSIQKESFLISLKVIIKLKKLFPFLNGPSF